MNQIETGASGHRPSRRGRWIRPAMLVVGMVLSMLVAGPAVPAQAATCGSLFQATDVHLTSNHLLGIYLQERQCTDADRFRVVVHNYSVNAVGNRAYGLRGCESFHILNLVWGAYIPAGGVWVSPEVAALDLDGVPTSVFGIIYRPLTTLVREVEVETGCVR